MKTNYLRFNDAFECVFRVITSFVQECMCVGRFEINAGEYCFLAHRRVRVREEDGGVEEVNRLFIKEMFDRDRGIMFVKGDNELEESAFPVLPSSDDVI